MCGVFSWIGSETPDMDKIKILGILNESRGTDSNGYFYNGEIKKGVADQKIFTNFVKDHLLLPVEGANVFIGHTRNSSVGHKHTAENAHPFQVNNLILAHNGTLKNAWGMCTKYGIDFKNIDVDSLALAHLIEQEGFKILDEYKGAATLLMHDIRESNTLMVYHGKSKKKPDGEEEEERPLFMMRTENGIYFSSLCYALDVIKEHDWEWVEEVPWNKVLKFKDGVLVEELPVTRGDVNVEYPAPAIYHGYAQNSYNKYAKKHQSDYVKNTALPSQNIKASIWAEEMPNKAYESIADIVFFWSGRYWKSVNSGKMSATEICDGFLNLSNRGLILNSSDKAGSPYYFYRGVMMRSCKDYLKVKDTKEIQDKLNDKTFNFASVISRYGKFPTTNLEDEAITVLPLFRFAWWRDGKIEKSGFTPKFSNRTYKFDNRGMLEGISCPDEAESPLFKKSTKITDEELIKKTGEELAFFQKKFEYKYHIELEMSEVGKQVLENFLRDAAYTEEKDLTDAEINMEIEKLFDHCILFSSSIEEQLPKTGILLDYIETALELSTKKEANKVVNFLDYAQNKSGMWVAKSEIGDEPPFPLDADKYDKCSECGGLGIDSDGKCKICCGAGYKAKDGGQAALFEDIQDDEAGIGFATSSFYEQKIIEDNESASNYLEDWFTQDLNDMETLIGKLEEFNCSPIAKEAAKIIKEGTSNLRSQMLDLATKYKLTNLKRELNAKKSLIC